jgi:hypothetical protein
MEHLLNRFYLRNYSLQARKLTQKFAQMDNLLRKIGREKFPIYVTSPEADNGGQCGAQPKAASGDSPGAKCANHFAAINA